MTYKTQPEALRLAARLENTEGPRLYLLPYAAAELRRLHAEVESLRIDAERYRWLRDKGDEITVCECTDGEWIPVHPKNIDATIDAAMEADAHECFCDRQYKDANKLASCGDCPRDYIADAWDARRKYIEEHSKMTDRYEEWRNFYAEKVRSWMSLDEIRTECGKLQTTDATSPEVLLIHAMHALEEYVQRASAQAELHGEPEVRAERMEKALKDIRSLSSINSAMNPNPFALTVMLGDIHHIADTALAKGEDNEQ